MPDHDVEVAQLTFEASGRPARDAARKLSPRTFTPVAVLTIAIGGGAMISAVRQTAPPSSIVVGRHVVAFLDTSDSVMSMAGSVDEEQSWMEAELEPLKAHGVTRTTIRVDGFGVNHLYDPNYTNFLKGLEANIGADTDTVYLFSDFNGFGGKVDVENAEGLAALRKLLTDRHLRLYLRTVRNQPSRELLAIARDSGGDFIGEP